MSKKKNRKDPPDSSFLKQECWICLVEDDIVVPAKFYTVAFGNVCHAHYHELLAETGEIVDDNETTATDTKESTKVGYYNNGSYTGKTSTPIGSYKSLCNDHKNPISVLNYHGMLVKGYKKADLPVMAGKKTLVLNLTGIGLFGGGNWPLKTVPAVLKMLDEKNKYGFDVGEEFLIDWPDRKGIAMRAEWWADALKEMKEAGFEQVNVCCFGGHGRTGTALACMLVACGAAKNGDDAVRIVRKNHCPEAIESTEQLDYIDYVCKHYGVKPTDPKTTV